MKKLLFYALLPAGRPIEQQQFLERVAMPFGNIIMIGVQLPLEPFNR